MNQIREIFEQEEEQFWDQFDKEEQLLVFCAVMRRLYKGDVLDRGSYRHVLYEVFGFDVSSYMRAQFAGYLDIHNLLVRPGDEPYEP